jgi:hypothetical protein
VRPMMPPGARTEARGALCLIDGEIVVTRPDGAHDRRGHD